MRWMLQIKSVLFNFKKLGVYNRNEYIIINLPHFFKSSFYFFFKIKTKIKISYLQYVR